MATTLTNEMREALEQLEKKHQVWRLAHSHTHPELTDPHLRSVLANELWVLRSMLRQSGGTMKEEWVGGVRTGLETMARRIQDVEKRGLEAVYAQNFKNHR